MSAPPSPCIIKSPSAFVVAVTVTKLCIVSVLVDSVSETRQLSPNDALSILAIPFAAHTV